MNLLKNIMNGKVILDLGCDQKVLKSISRRYIGIDIYGNPDILANLENGIPLKNKSVDMVIAMNVLEHLENIHYLFDEMCRVSKEYIVIGLPNMYEWRFRLMYLLGKRISGKYGLPLDPPTDRHRWLFSLDEARKFVHYKAEKNGFSVMEEIYPYYKYKNPLAKLVTWLGKKMGKRGLGLFAYSYWVVLKRK